MNQLQQYYNLPAGDLVYDIETYPNVFCIGIQHHETGKRWYFDHRHILPLCQFMWLSRQVGNRWVGFNNIGFDYPVLHFIYQNYTTVTVEDIYHKAMSIIRANGPLKFAHMVWESDWVNPQIDLFKIHHFDNKAKSTGLKILEFNMCMGSIEDLPFKPGTVLSSDQASTLAEYMWHDIKATDQFYVETLEQIRFREELTQKYNHSFMNHNDTKIGKDYFIMKLEEQNPGCCYKRVNGKRRPNQSPRAGINLGEIILPYIQFEHSEFKRVLSWFQSQIITETKGSIKDVNAIIDGFQYDFGTGGIHGSVDSQVLYSDAEMIIEDWDVASYYPNLAIANGLYPEHLGQTFCVIYKNLYEQRKKHKKGTAENAMLKLALNGTYGDSNNKYSPFYDPKFTMSITINGQLSLCMLAEQLIKLTGLNMVQINTDGLTIRYPRRHQTWVHQVCRWWEGLTGLTLENAEYNRMMIRDCNNYIAEYTDGKLKRKGAYEYNLGWHQNHSALVVPKAASAVLVYGVSVRDFIVNHDDAFDFFLRTKVPRNASLEWGGEQVDNIVRYYISTDGKPLEKVMPPAGPEGEYKRANSLTDEFYNSVMAEIGPGVWDERIHTKNKSRYEQRRTGINIGWGVQILNNIVNEFEFETVNYDWYIKEAEKLTGKLLNI